MRVVCCTMEVYTDMQDMRDMQDLDEEDGTREFSGLERQARLSGVSGVRRAAGCLCLNSVCVCTMGKWRTRGCVCTASTCTLL